MLIPRQFIAHNNQVTVAGLNVAIDDDAGVVVHRNRRISAHRRCPSKSARRRNSNFKSCSQSCRLAGASLAWVTGGTG